jgi:hypothetical protein
MHQQSFSIDKQFNLGIKNIRSAIVFFLLGFTLELVYHLLYPLIGENIVPAYFWWFISIIFIFYGVWGSFACFVLGTVLLMIGSNKLSLLYQELNIKYLKIAFIILIFWLVLKINYIIVFLSAIPFFYYLINNLDFSNYLRPGINLLLMSIFLAFVICFNLATKEIKGYSKKEDKLLVTPFFYVPIVALYIIGAILKYIMQLLAHKKKE